MELPDDAPKLPKLPFILGDLIFLGLAAYLLAKLGPAPSTASVVAIIACAGIGALLLVAPFVINYDRQRDLQLTERQNALEALARTTSATAEQASIATASLHEIADLTQRNLHSLEELPKNIESARQAAKAKENHQHATAVEALRSDFDQLREDHAGTQESINQLLEKLGEQLGEIESTFSTRLQALEARLQSPVPSIVLPTPLPTPVQPAPPPAPPPAAAPVIAETSPPAPPPPSDPVAESAATDPVAESAAVPAAAPKPSTKKPRKPARPPEPSLFDAAAPPPGAHTEPTPTEDNPPLDEEPLAEPSRSADGQTRLTVTAYIGIGNRLFVRGDGPGLSPDEGTPLQFVSIGKWRWETDAATEAVKLTLWKNDQTLCTALGEIELAPGSHLETNASF